MSLFTFAIKKEKKENFPLPYDERWQDKMDHSSALTSSLPVERLSSTPSE